MKHRTPESIASSDNVVMVPDARFEVTWKAEDAENPKTWSVWYRSFIVAAMSFSTTIVYVS
jgi:hypothetical protein